MTFACLVLFMTKTRQKENLLNICLESLYASRGFVRHSLGWLILLCNWSCVSHYATKWSRTLWLLSKSSALYSCCFPHFSLKGKPICSDVSHNHVDSSANSALKAIACLTLPIVTIVAPPCLSSNLPAYLGSSFVKIMPISGCCGERFVVRIPLLHATLSTCHLDPVASCESPYQTPLRPRIVHIVCTSLGVLAFATILYSRTLARAAHSTKNPVRVMMMTAEFVERGWLGVIVVDFENCLAFKFSLPCPAWFFNLFRTTHFGPLELFSVFCAVLIFLRCSKTGR